MRNFEISDTPSDILKNKYEESRPIIGNLTLYFTKKDFTVSPVVEFRVAKGKICLRNSYSEGVGNVQYKL